jgi:hypothetical protein
VIRKEGFSYYRGVKKAMVNQNKRQVKFGLAIWRGDDYILNFSFADRLLYQPTNNAEQ